MESKKNDYKKMGKEKMKEVAVKSYCPWKVSVVQNFSLSCGKRASPITRKDYVNDQQGENGENEEDRQEVEDDSDYD
ncbi:Uncharacterized protein TCM_013162 [Theobroma cacao]|uniref:Uncharacterized protein n=1 Tax=Theobroma cacao TaxID=3641 RepID=A0A061FVC6_THECC|nr:Uncharacterized protein TCM_013162 [Theobroma cacao]